MSAALPEPACPAWCDRRHGGFAREGGGLTVEHLARRAGYELVVNETVDVVTGVVAWDTPAVLTPDFETLEAPTPRELATALRERAAVLGALASMLDPFGGEPTA